MQAQRNRFSVSISRRLAGDGRPLRPADAYLRESEPGQSAYSPETQLESIKDAMVREDYYCANVERDEQRGRVVNRPGYQRIKARVEQGLTEGVFVYMMARWGRDAVGEIGAGTWGPPLMRCTSRPTGVSVRLSGPFG